MKNASPDAGVEEELHGAGPGVSARSGEVDRRLMDAFARGIGKPGRRRLLQHLLRSTLHRAIAVAEVDGILSVSEDLHLDVPGMSDETLEVHRVVAEGGARLAPGDRQCFVELLR
ncbi:hypothetical protein QE412_000349 [Microbacterium trichothecenolyticum]|uniref:Uncharacterized protein n=1 Tax=Microbacterium trichothecenolyticum TaxID=69370 RepID=A0ABU0TQ26_MICTR|nr:hypothetical protein [Microbacterium trichothecenolyticum]